MLSFRDHVSGFGEELSGVYIWLWLSPALALLVALEGWHGMRLQRGTAGNLCTAWMGTSVVGTSL